MTLAFTPTAWSDYAESPSIDASQLNRLEAGIGAVTTEVIALEAALPGTYQPLSAELSALVGAASSPGYSKRTGAASWSMVASIPQADVASSSGWISTALAGREPALGNPATSGYVLASTAAGVRSWVALPSGSTTTPLMDGTAAVGAGTTWARADHVHPTDTSRQAASAVLTNVAAQSSGTGFLRLAAGVASLDTSSYALASAVPSASSTTPAAIGTAAVGTGTTWARADHVHALPSSGVTAGSYGSATVVPVLTVDATGRITGMSAAAITPAAIGAATATGAENWIPAYTGASTLGQSILRQDATYGILCVDQAPANGQVGAAFRNATTGTIWRTINRLADGCFVWGHFDSSSWRDAATLDRWGSLTLGMPGGAAASITMRYGSRTMYLAPTSGGGVIDCLGGALNIANGGLFVDYTVDADTVIANSIMTEAGVLRAYPIASTSGALYGSAVATPDGGNYSLRWTTNGAYALLNGTTESILAINGSWVVKATSTGAQINSPWFPIQATNPTAITNSGRWHFTGVATCSLGAPTAGRMVFLTRTIGAYTVTLTTPSGVIIWSAGVGGVATAGSGASMAYGYGGVVLMADGTNWCAC